MRDLKAALLPFIMTASEVTYLSLPVPPVTHICMPHALSDKRTPRLVCACRYCCCVLHTATRRCFQLPYIVVDVLGPFAAAAASRCGARSTWFATSWCTADGGLKLKAVFQCCKSGLVASAGNQRVNADVTCATDTRGPLRDSVRPSR